jgi:hypothetical protein
VLAEAPDGTPVLAAGEHGLGRCLYVGTGLSGPWGEDWQAWTEFPRWIGQAVRWIKRRPERAEPPRILFDFPARGGLEVSVLADPAAPAPEEPPVLRVKTGEGAETREFPVLRAGSHRYTAVLPPGCLPEASVLEAVFPPGAGSHPLRAEAPVPREIPFERSHHEPDLEGLRLIAAATGGQLSPSPEAVLRFSPAGRTVPVDLAWAALLAALSLLPLIALLRRRRT